MSDRGELGSFLKTVIHWNWREFCLAERDPKHSSLEATVLALVRTAADAKLGAIRLAIERVDGKLETPVKMVYPKMWFTYPEATTTALPPASTPAALPSPSITLEVPPSTEEEPVNIATMSLRETLKKMADSPRQVVPLILKKKREVEDNPEAEIEAPLVKSVITANLLQLATEGSNFDAITEVFDQIDGKLVETIKILGDDIYLPQYALEAPYGAVKNKDGIYQIEAKEVADLWRQKLSLKHGG